MNRKTSPIRLRPLRVGLSLLLALGPVVVREAWAKEKKPAPVKNVALVWPLPPETPRIKFVAAIYGAPDVEPSKKANFLDRLAGIEKKDSKLEFVKPYGIATDSHHRIYVTDSGQGLVFILDRDHKQVSYIGDGTGTATGSPGHHSGRQGPGLGGRCRGPACLCLRC